MKRAVVLTLSAVALVASLSVSTRASSAGAIVIKDELCGLFDGDGGVVMGSGSIQVTNQGGFSLLKCSVKNVPNSTGRAVRYDFASTGMPCGTANGSTEDWQEVVSASGNATLTCRYRNK
jgi:hypothetical protein